MIPVKFTILSHLLEVRKIPELVLFPWGSVEIVQLSLSLHYL